MAGAQAAWGLDVGITSLKAIKLRKDGEKVALETFDVVEHDTFLSEPDVDRDEIIRTTLRKFLERNVVRGDMVFIGVPGASTFARFVKLPPVDPRKIPEIVRFEAIQQIPFPLDQVNWDYQVFTNPESPDVEVGIFAMKKELVAQVLANFRATGMTVQGVQMSPLAVYNAAMYDGMTQGKGTVLLDMGAEHTDLVIVDQGRLWLRTINIGGNHFTDALAKSFKQPFARAEQLKKTAATSKYQKQIFQAMRPIFADLVAEVQRSIGHYNSSHRDSRLEQMVGMGNPFKLPNLQKYLQQELKMDVVRLDSYKKVEAEGKLAAGLTENILPMTAAYGLAVQALELAPIDTTLLPMEIARQMMWRLKRTWFMGVAGLFLVGVFFLWMQNWRTNSAYVAAEPKRAEHKGIIDQATRRANDLRTMPNTFEADKKTIEAYMKLGAERAIWPMLTQDILGALPQAKSSTGPAIVVLSIDSEYRASLAASGPAGTGGQPTAAASAASDDRGFAITIRGYVSAGANGEAGYTVVRDYLLALEGRAKKEGKKPYYFTHDGSGYAGAAIMGTGPTGAVEGPWGKNKGPYWNLFAPDIAGIQVEAPPPGAVTNTKPDIKVSGVNLFAKPSAGGPAPSIAGCFDFTMSFKVHMKGSK